MYSHAEKTLPGASWAAGTESTVSSTFMHLAPFRAGLPLRPTLRRAGVPDGMRDYTVDERTAAGNSLWTNIANKAHASCRYAPDAGAVILGGAGSLIGGPYGISIGVDLGEQAGDALCNDIAGNVANQTANCFASDACDDLGPTWRDPGTGVTVSPDDILRWDPPKQDGSGGTYGFNEPAYYLPFVVRRQYVWKPVDGAGTITVKVLGENLAPFPNAQVILNGVPIGVTDPSGTIVAEKVAPGAYDVEAQYSPCGPFVPGSQPVPPNPDTLPVCPQDGPVPAVCSSGYGGGACPKDFASVSCVEGNCTYCTADTCGNDVDHASDPNADMRCERNCVCRAPQAPACTQPLLRAAKPATLSSGGSTTVVLTLCAGSYVNNGTTCAKDLDCPVGNTCKLGYCNNAAGCRQGCDTDADCFNTLECENKTCVPRPSVVKIFDGVNLQIYDHDAFESPTRTQYSLFNDMVCDPSINGGKVTYSYCGLDDDGERIAQYVFEVTCNQDPTDGHFTVINDAHLDEGCGSDASRRSDDAHWVVTLPPDKGSAGPSGGSSCWSTCDENHAYFTYSYTSVRK